MIDNIKDKASEAASGVFNFPQIDSDLKVWFVFKDEEYELSQFNIGFGQATDYKGQPQDEVRGGVMMLTIADPVSDKIYKWAMKSLAIDGVIEFRSKTASSPLKIEFTNGYCVNFDRVIEAGTGLSTMLTISPEEIRINGVNFDNHWV